MRWHYKKAHSNIMDYFNITFLLLLNIMFSPTRDLKNGFPSHLSMNFSSLKFRTGNKKYPIKDIRDMYLD